MRLKITNSRLQAYHQGVKNNFEQQNVRTFDQHGMNATWRHYDDVIMSEVASQITSLTIVFTQPFIRAQIKENIKAPRHWPLCGIHRWPVNFPHKWPVTRKIFPFDDVIMNYRLLMFVCCITKSFLTYSFFPPTPALSAISRPLSSSMCSITPETANVGSSLIHCGQMANIL